MSCQPTKITSVDIQGHRGARGLLPENTLQAFNKAIALGVHTLELDVAVSKDGIVVVSHEPYMNHEIMLTPDGQEISKAKEQSYNLYAMTYDSIKQYDCGLKVHPRFPEQQKIKAYKPTLKEVIVEAEKRNPNIRYNIEIKAQPDYDEVYTPTPKVFVDLVLAVLKETEVFNRTNLQSFDIRVLEAINRASPNMKVALLVDENETIENKLKSLSFTPEIISPYYKLLSKTVVSDFQNRGFLIIPWTVNTVTEMEEMIAFKVDGIITDYPDKLVALFK